MKKGLITIFAAVAAMAAMVSINTAFAESGSLAWEDFTDERYTDGIQAGENGGTGFATAFGSNSNCSEISFANPNTGNKQDYFAVADKGLMFARQDNKLYRQLTNEIDITKSGEYFISYDMYLSASSVADNYNVKFLLGNEIYGGVKKNNARVNEVFGTEAIIEAQKSYTVIMNLSVNPDGESVLREQIIPLGEKVKSAWDAESNVVLTENIKYIGLSADGWGSVTYYDNIAIDVYTADEAKNIIDGYSVQITYKNIEKYMNAVKIGGRMADNLKIFITDSVIYETFDNYKNTKFTADILKSSDSTGTLNDGYGFNGAWYYTGMGANMTSQSVNAAGEVQTWDGSLVLKRDLAKAIDKTKDGEYFMSISVKNSQDFNSSSSPEMTSSLDNRFILGSDNTYAGLIYDSTKGGYVPQISINGSLTKGDKIILTKKDYNNGFDYRYFIRLSIENGIQTLYLMIVDEESVLQPEWDLIVTGSLPQNIGYVGFTVKQWFTTYFDDLIIESYNVNTIRGLNKENITDEELNNMEEGLAKDYVAGCKNFNDGKVSVKLHRLANTENRKLETWNLTYDNIKDKGVTAAVDLKNGTGKDKNVTIIFAAFDETTGKLTAVKTKDVTLPQNKYSGCINVGFNQEELLKFSENPQGFVYKTFIIDGFGSLVPLTERKTVHLPKNQ